MDENMRGALRLLKQSLHTIKTLAEWVKLKAMENRTISPALQLPDSSSCDLMLEVWYFKALAQAIESGMGRDFEAKALLDQLRQEFNRVELPIAL